MRKEWLVGRWSVGLTGAAGVGSFVRLRFVRHYRTQSYVRMSLIVFSSLLPSVPSLLFMYKTAIVESNESKPRQCRRKNPEIVPLEARRRWLPSIIVAVPPSAFCAFCSCALPEPALDGPPTDSYSYPLPPHYIYYFQNDAPFRLLRSHRFGFRLCPSPAGW